MTVEEYRQRMKQALNNPDCDELIAVMDEFDETNRKDVRMTVTDRLLAKIDEKVDLVIKRIEEGKSEFTGCQDCTFAKVEEWKMPCAKCKHGCKDYFRRVYE